jgi:hypothetical protein
LIFDAGSLAPDYCPNNYQSLANDIANALSGTRGPPWVVEIPIGFLARLESAIEDELKLCVPASSKVNVLVPAASSKVKEDLGAVASSNVNVSGIIH